MNKKKMLVLSLSALLTMGVVAAAASTKVLTKINADEEVIWNHYSATDAGLDIRGIKEYWVSCGTHEHQFEKPEVVDRLIVDKGAPEQEFINSLPEDDDRLVFGYKLKYNFEDGDAISDIISIKSGFTSLAINETQGVGGSKCLEAVMPESGADSFLKIKKAYLDQVFADPNVKALAFDAKGTHATNNFRHARTTGDTAAYKQECYENNLNGYGIDTIYKTFYLDRALYETAYTTDDETFIKYGISGTADMKLYIDNLRPVFKAASDNSAIGFEDGTILAKDGSNTSVRNGMGTQICLASGAGYSSLGYDYTKCTEGNRSLVINKVNGYVAIYFNTSIIGNEGVCLDVYSHTVDGGGGTGLSILANDNEKLLPAPLNNWGSPADGWVRYCVPKSRIGADGRTLIISGSPAGEIYIDNIRTATKFESFESTMYTTAEKDYVYATNYPFVSGGHVRDTYKNSAMFMNGSVWKTIEVTSEKATDGRYSLKMTSSAKGAAALFISPTLVKYAYDNGMTVKFDMYTTQSFTGGTVFGNMANANCLNKWGTMSFSGDNLLDPAKAANGANGRLCNLNINGAATVYVDNIRLEALPA